jgi:hypothetical protein
MKQTDSGKSPEQSIIGTLTCDACFIGADILHTLAKSTLVQDIVETAGVMMCTKDLALQVCRGYVNSLKNTVINQLEGLIFSPQYVCTEYVAACDQKYY